MTALFCAIGALIILVYPAFAAAYVKRIAERQELYGSSNRREF